MNAQASYTQLIRHYVGPEMRKLGFVGSGSKYTLPNDTYYILIGLQKSKWNTAERVEFALNLSIVEKRLWHNATQNMPHHNTYNPGAILERRLPVPTGWWEMTGTSDVSDLAQRIIDMMKSYALPAIYKVIA